MTLSHKLVCWEKANWNDDLGSKKYDFSKVCYPRPHKTIKFLSNLFSVTPLNSYSFRNRWCLKNTQHILHQIRWSMWLHLCAWHCTCCPRLPVHIILIFHGLSRMYSSQWHMWHLSPGGDDPKLCSSQYNVKTGSRERTVELQKCREGEGWR